MGLRGALFDAVRGINRMFDDKKLHRLKMVCFSFFLWQREIKTHLFSVCLSVGGWVAGMFQV